MNIKLTLIALTLVSVTVDTLLLPYYPIFFEQAFQVSDAEVTGAYLAMSCLTVMLCLPLWAKVAKNIHELDLWVVTQLIAGTLAIACYFVTELWLFWLLSQLMLAFKASYLLIYPFVLRLESRDQHLGLVGLFSVLMHIGGIGGAFLGGVWMTHFSAQAVYLLMACADILQVGLCFYLKTRISAPVNDTHEAASQKTNTFPLLIKLCIISVFVYFSAFLIRPFFTLYWQDVSQIKNTLITACVYAIPAIIALCCLGYDHIKISKKSHLQLLGSAIGLSIAATLLQSQPHMLSIVLGRILYAWALYQMTVRLELILFEASPQADFGQHFAKLHISQNIGLIAASFASAALVDTFGLSTPFYLSAAGFLCAFVALLFLFSTVNTAKTVEVS